MSDSKLDTGYLKLCSSKCKVATCNLNQHAMDFDNNLERIISAIRVAKSLGVKLLNMPELAICGYSCEDHFHETDTFDESLDSLAKILEETKLNSPDILCAVGCPLMYNNTRYNCVVFILDGQIKLIRPKLELADDGNYRERRWFTPWTLTNKLVEYKLPSNLSVITNQKNVLFGFAILKLNDCTISEELCEELWSPNSPHVPLYLAGVDIILNSSGSHTELRKLTKRIELVTSATKKCGGAYLYSNSRGCDGTRLYFDGCSMISVNGMLTKQASQFSLQDVEVIVGIIDLNEIRRYRQGSNSLQHQISESIEKSKIPCVEIDFNLGDINLITTRADISIEPTIPVPEEECVFGPACWLWDYCRRSGMAGFLLPLSGGADSATVCAIIYTMCRLVINECNLDNKQVIHDLKIILNKCNFKLDSTESSLDLIKNSRLASDYRGIITKDDLVFRNITSKGLCNLMLHTVYMGTTHSSTQTKGFAEILANSVGSFHCNKNIQKMVDTTRIEFEDLSREQNIPLKPKFQSFGGSYTEDLALQNIQARTRMVMAYMCAQLFPQARGFKGSLLVLGSANVDESLRGYFTKYDCSSADLNPIGSISKKDLKKTLHWYAEAFGFDILRSIVIAPPTAELRPILANSKDTYTQKDEDEMGMTYDELSVFGLLRKQKRCGPVSMFLELLNEWVHLSPVEIAVKVKRFFFYYSINRHKMTTLTPSYHAESYSPDDNRFDLRPFLYNAKWSRQFDKIDLIVTELAIINDKIAGLKY